MKKHIKRGFSLAELGIALVILLIVSTIAAISYFSIIDNAKEVKIIEDTETLQLALARQDIDIREYSTEFNFEDLEQEIQGILNYHLDNGTNLKGLVFPNEVLLDNDGNYILGELKVKKSDLGSNTALLDIFNIEQVKADEDNKDLNLEVRKIDNNKIKKLFNGDFTEDWYIIDSTGNHSRVMEDVVEYEDVYESNYSVGSVLSEPELGWKRIDDTNEHFNYEGKWETLESVFYYGGSDHRTRSVGSKVSFEFVGTRVRIIMTLYPNWSESYKVTIDGKEQMISAVPSFRRKTIAFEEFNLPYGNHKVELELIQDNRTLYFDAIDINEDGELLSN